MKRQIIAKEVVLHVVFCLFEARFLGSSWFSNKHPVVDSWKVFCCKIIYAWPYFISFRVQQTCLWKSPPLVMQDWLVSLCTEVCICSFLEFKIHKKRNPIIYLLCDVLSAAGCDLIHSTRRGKESATAPMRWESRSYRWSNVSLLCLLVFSHFTWGSISSCWMRPGTKSAKTTLVLP